MQVIFFYNIYFSGWNEDPHSYSIEDGIVGSFSAILAILQM